MNLIELEWLQNPLGRKKQKIIKRGDVLRAVSVHTGVSIQDMISQRKDNKTLWARYYAIDICRRHTIGATSLAAIGKALRRDHTTILNALNKVNKRIESGDIEIKEDIETIESLLGLNHND